MCKRIGFPALLILFASFTVLAAQEQKTNGEVLQKVKTMGKGSLLYPAGPVPMITFGALLVVDEGELLLFDAGGEQPFQHIDVKTEEITPFGSWGQGPGEIDNNAFIILSQTTDHIYAFNMVAHTLHRFDRKMRHVRSLVLEDFSSTMSVMLQVNEDDLYFAEYGLDADQQFNEAFFETFTSENQTLINKDEPVLFYEEHPELHPIRENNALKHGPIVKARDNTVYAGNVFGSAILGINTDGEVVFKTDQPEQAPIPEAEQRVVNGYRVGEPEHSVFRNIDLAVNSEHVFALYSGIEATFDEASRFIMHGDIDEDRRIGEAKTVRLYNRDDASYAGEYHLPEWTVAIAADEQYLYAVVWDREPYLSVLNLPENT